MEFKHKSVLLDETIEGLRVKPDGIYVDGTLGGAGHATEVCKKLSAKGRFIGIDQDQDAIIAASERLSAFNQVTIIRSNYCYMADELRSRGIEKVDGILLDLGVSSYQLDNEERGFSYRYDSPLDMRMDRRQSRTAGDIVNGYEERELYRIIRDYGEDKFAKNIAKHIVAARAQAPIQTTGELTEIIRGAIPMKVQATGGHPAKRTFQSRVSGRVTERRLGAAKKAELPTVVTPGVTRTSSTPSRISRQSPWGLSARSVMGPVPEMVRSRRERL